MGGAGSEAAPDAAFAPGSYLRDRIPQICVGAFALAMLAGMLGVLGVGAQATVLLVALMGACMAVILAMGYARRARFYRELEALADQLDRAYRVTALIDEPDFLDGRATWRALDAAARSAANEYATYQEQMKAYRDFVELWIHEIKTPIAAADLMAADLHGPVASKLKGELDRIEAHVEQALYYARSTSLSHDYAIREVPLAQAVRDACKKHARLLIERGATPSIDVGEDVSVYADAAWLSFILGQVLSNAAKYGAATVRFSVREEGDVAGSGRTVLEIADDGQGIPASDVPRVFEHGYIGQNGRAQGSATGMGLYLVALMCEKMGLGAAIASEEGSGTRVMVAFPRDRRRADFLAD